MTRLQPLPEELDPGTEHQPGPRAALCRTRPKQLAQERSWAGLGQVASRDQRAARWSPYLAAAGGKGSGACRSGNDLVPARSQPVLLLDPRAHRPAEASAAAYPTRLRTPDHRRGAPSSMAPLIFVWDNVNTHLSATMCTFIQAPRQAGRDRGIPRRAGLAANPDHRNPRPGLSARMDLELIYGLAIPGSPHGAVHADVPAAPGQLRVWVPPVPVVVVFQVELSLVTWIWNALA